MIHRDLKPANIMVGAFGEVQVVDWGLAKVPDPRGGVSRRGHPRAPETFSIVIETVRSGPETSGGSSHSVVGSVMGTLAYMAPEQAQGEIEKLDERADVFSLGAILCELLTGKPPYDHVEGEKTTVRAARAKLDPARERIESCDADEALKRLCLDCLMPARDARPDNADEVARALRDHLTSVEDRAREAELAATEARVKAEQERRARVLTLSLAATIVAALVLGGGGYYFVREERAARLEQTRTAVEAAQGESIELGQADRPDEALAAAQRALALAETGEVDAALVERAERFVTQAQAAVGAAERERGLERQDEVLRARLEELRLEQVATIGNPRGEARSDEAFAQAFETYGVDLEGDDLVPALERIRERDIAQEVALALDDWARIRRIRYGLNSDEALNLFYLAMDLDPEPMRMRLRQAIQDADLDVLLELAEPENLPDLAPGSIWVLGSTLWRGYPMQRPVVYRMYDHALHLYPDDFVLQFIGGVLYGNASRQADALRCWGAAMGLRPGNANVRWRMAESLFFSGQMTEALGAYRAAIEIDPELAGAYYGAGMSLYQLGDYVGALGLIERALELGEDAGFRADLDCARFMTGAIDKDEIVALLHDTTDPMLVSTYAWALVDHSDPRQREPELVLDVIASAPDLGANHIIEAVARIRLQDWEGALAALHGHYGPSSFLVITPGALDFIRALIYAELGQATAARDTYDRAMAGWDALTGGQPEAWERSDVMHWRRAAESVLGL